MHRRKDINYTWTEPRIPYYNQTDITTKTDEDNLIATTITNTYMPGTVSQTVRKVWVDQSDTDRPTVLNMILTGSNGDVRMVTLSDANDWTALMIASIRGHTKTVSVLMKYGADVNTKNEDGMTALMMASMCGYYATPEAILKHGVDVNVTDNDGNTALYWALWDGHRETAELLRRYGAKR